jgi:hypothetical protein
VKDQREWIDVIDPPMICGVLSVLPLAYLGSCVLSAHELFGAWWCKESPVFMLIGIFLSVPLSAIAGAYGSRFWWLVTAISVGALLFFVFRLH